MDRLGESPYRKFQRSKNEATESNKFVGGRQVESTIDNPNNGESEEKVRGGYDKQRGREGGDRGLNIDSLRNRKKYPSGTWHPRV